MDTKELNKLWNAGNDAGDGYGVGDDSDDINKIKGIGKLVSKSNRNDEVAVYEKGNKYIVVGDANGPWAVDVLKSKVASVRASLIKIGGANPALRPHIRPVLAALDKESSMEGPVGVALDKHWNDLHDFESALDNGIKEYDRAASYMGGPGEKDADAVITEVKKVQKMLNDVSKALEKLHDKEMAFTRKHKGIDTYVRSQQDRMGLK